jgi:hypothetical protein
MYNVKMPAFFNFSLFLISSQKYKWDKFFEHDV